jgi:hypothetical protein
VNRGLSCNFDGAVVQWRDKFVAEGLRHIGHNETLYNSVLPERPSVFAGDVAGSKRVTDPFQGYFSLPSYQLSSVEHRQILHYWVSVTHCFSHSR